MQKKSKQMRIKSIKNGNENRIVDGSLPDIVTDFQGTNSHFFLGSQLCNCGCMTYHTHYITFGIKSINKLSVRLPRNVIIIPVSLNTDIFTAADAFFTVASVFTANFLILIVLFLLGFGGIVLYSLK